VIYLPIAMTTYNRAKYTKATISSLEQSNADMSALHIHDDGSTDADAIDLLSKYDKTYYVHRHVNRGSYQAVYEALDDVFRRYVTRWVCYIQNDVEVSKNWLRNGMALAYHCNTASDCKLGIFSLYNRKEDKAREKWYTITEGGHPGGVCWLVNRQWWTDYKKEVNEDMDGMRWLPTNDRRSDHYRRHIVDYKMCDACKRMGWVVGAVGRSLVQHVGDKSSIGDKDMTFCRVKNYVG